MLYFPGVTAATVAVLWLVNLNDDRATLPLCFAVSVGAGALASLAETLSAAATVAVTGGSRAGQKEPKRGDSLSSGWSIKRAGPGPFTKELEDVGRRTCPYATTRTPRSR